MFPWKQDISQLASYKNVYCKLSGMVTEAEWGRWKPQDFFPYLDVVYEAFGPERLMIGSDWPVCTLSASYKSTMGIVLDYLDSVLDEEKDLILGGNCRKFYRLD